MRYPNAESADLHSLESLVQHTRWMTELARSLTGDADQADDVVQDTWISALRKPPTAPDDARPWLAVVLRNVVRQRSRTAGRREARERAHAPREEIVDAAELVERAEMHRRVVNALMSLSEPNRGALLRRYFEGLSVREIARDEGVPHETVKARIQRGLAHLRTKLDHSFGGRQAWTAAIGVLAAGTIGGKVAVPTGTAAGGAAVASSISSTSIGAAVAVKGAVVTGAVVAGVAFGLPLLDNSTTAPPVVTQPAALTAAAADETTRRPAPAFVNEAREGDNEPTVTPSRPARRAPRRKTPTRTAEPVGGEQPAGPSREPRRVEHTEGASAPPTESTRRRRRRAELPIVPPRQDADKSDIERAPLLKTPEFEVTPELRELFKEWVELKDTSDLKELKDLRDIRAELDAHLAKLGPDVLKAVGSWCELLDLAEDRKGRRGRWLNRKWKLEKKQHRYHLWAPPEKPARGYRSVISLVNRSKRGRPADYLNAAWVKNRSPVLAAIPVAPKKQRAFAWSDRANLIHTLGMLGMQIRQAYHTDHNALFLDGYGTAGVEAWHFASSFADLFAGVIIRGALPPQNTRFADFVNTPFLLVSDPMSPLTKEATDRIANEMRKAGVDVTVAHLPERGKDVKRFRTIDEAVSAFLEKRRDPYPTYIDWSVKQTHTRRAFWMKARNEIEDVALPVKARGRAPQFKVRIDRKTNGIVIDSHRIESFLFLLNDALVDLDRPVRVTVNGRVVHEARLERSFKELIDNWEVFGDNTAVYPASLVINAGL